MFACLGFSTEVAERIYTNAKIWTADPSNPHATAMAILKNRIIAVGSDADMEPFRGEATEMIDLKGKRVTPGFIDNHTHFNDLAGLLTAVQIRDADSKEEFVRRIGEFAKGLRPGQWMLKGIWDHEAWGGQLPEAQWIDAVTGNNPVFLPRTDAHMALANTAAMKLAAIDQHTQDVPGGEIVRYQDGTPTGILKDAAMELFQKVVPQISTREEAATFERAVDHALRFGVTQVHDMGTWANLQAFKELRSTDRLKMRVYSFVPLPSHQQLVAYVEANGRGDDMHRWGGLKGMFDGSLGSSTAWFYDAFADQPGKKGFPIYDLQEFGDWIKAGDLAGLHITIHAIGDRSNDWVLDKFEAIASANPANKQRRWRIEHAQHLSPTAITRMSKLNVIPSMQPYHAIDDGRWAEKRIGPKRAKTTYAFKSLSDAQAVITFGSDCPVAPINVMQGIYAAVTRQTLDGAHPNGWVPEEKVSVEQALKAYTINSAYAGFQEDRLGQLKAGYLADFVVLEQDILEIPAVKIKDVEVNMTVVDGSVVYRKSQDP